MQKLLLLTLLIFFSVKNYAQTTPEKNAAGKDSADLLKDFMDLMKDPDKPSSYFTAGVGFGNRLFSLHNNELNTTQTAVNTIIYSPSVSYYNKSGFNISAGASLLNDSTTGFGVNQYSISPGYQLQGNDNVDFSIAYTHYFVKNKYSAYASPVQNDLYTSFTYKKAWLQPGVAVGFSTGEYSDIKRKKLLYDSTINKLRAFSFIASLGHEFMIDKVFNKNDGLIFTPSLMLNTGSDKINIHHNTNATNLVEFLNKRGKLPKIKNHKFAAESVGLDLNASYVTGNLTIAPEIYLDYYLPESDVNKFTSVFALTFNYSF